MPGMDWRTRHGSELFSVNQFLKVKEKIQKQGKNTTLRLRKTIKLELCICASFVG